MSFHCIHNQRNPDGYGSFDSYESLDGQSHKNSNILPFPYKLYHLLQNETNDSIQWHFNGLAFHISNTTKFTNELVHKYFKHRRYSSFQRQLNLYGFRKNMEAGVNGSYFHVHFQRGREDLLKQVIRLNAVSHSHREAMTTTSRNNAVLCAQDNKIADQCFVESGWDSGGAQPRCHSLSQSVLTKQQPFHSTERPDDEWKFPSVTMEDYWQIMDERVMLYFCQPNDLYSTDGSELQCSSSESTLPLRLDAAADTGPFGKCESSNLTGGTLSNPSSIRNTPVDNSKLQDSEYARRTILMLPQVAESTDTAEDVTIRHTQDATKPGLNLCSPITVRLHSKREAPFLHRPLAGAQSITQHGSSVPIKRVRFDCKVSDKDPSTESELHHQSPSLHPQPHLIQMQPPSAISELSLFCYPVRDPVVSPASSRYLLLPHNNKEEFSRLATSGMPHALYDSSSADESSATYVTLSTDSELSSHSGYYDDSLNY